MAEPNGVDLTKQGVITCLLKLDFSLLLGLASCKRQRDDSDHRRDRQNGQPFPHGSSALRFRRY